MRCRPLRPDPARLRRLHEIRGNLTARIAEAHREGWLGEIAGLEATVAAADQKLQAMEHGAGRHAVTHLIWGCLISATASGGPEPRCSPCAGRMSPGAPGGLLDPSGPSRPR